MNYEHDTILKFVLNIMTFKIVSQREAQLITRKWNIYFLFSSLWFRGKPRRWVLPQHKLHHLILIIWIRGTPLLCCFPPVVPSTRHTFLECPTWDSVYWLKKNFFPSKGRQRICSTFDVAQGRGDDDLLQKKKQR